MSRLNKIDHMGLAIKIDELAGAGITKTKDIALKLRELGFNVSQPTVSRWLKQRREQQKSDTQKIVQDHVKAVVPADLIALEDMEIQCLDLAKLQKGDFGHRLAAKNINERLDAWLDILRDLEGQPRDSSDYAKARYNAIKTIMAEALLMVGNEFQLEKMRSSSRRTAIMIIDLKLRHALGSEGESNVFIAGEDETRTGCGPDKSTGNVLTFPGEHS
jgi:DNA-binding transcriptional ArsR family regulator